MKINKIMLSIFVILSVLLLITMSYADNNYYHVSHLRSMEDNLQLSSLYSFQEQQQNTLSENNNECNVYIAKRISYIINCQSDLTDAGWRDFLSKRNYDCEHMTCNDIAAYDMEIQFTKAFMGIWD